MIVSARRVSFVREQFALMKATWPCEMLFIRRHDGVEVIFRPGAPSEPPYHSKWADVVAALDFDTKMIQAMLWKETKA